MNRRCLQCLNLISFWQKCKRCSWWCGGTSWRWQVWQKPLGTLRRHSLTSSCSWGSSLCLSFSWLFSLSFISSRSRSFISPAASSVQHLWTPLSAVIIHVFGLIGTNHSSRIQVSVLLHCIKRLCLVNKPGGAAAALQGCSGSVVSSQSPAGLLAWLRTSQHTTDWDDGLHLSISCSTMAADVLWHVPPDAPLVLPALDHPGLLGAEWQHICCACLPGCLGCLLVETKRELKFDWCFLE